MTTLFREVGFIGEAPRVGSGEMPLMEIGLVPELSPGGLRESAWKMKQTWRVICHERFIYYLVEVFSFRFYRTCSLELQSQISVQA